MPRLTQPTFLHLPWPVWALVPAALAVPALLMRFWPQSGVEWELSDFAMMAVLLSTALLALAAGWRRIGRGRARWWLALAVLLGFGQVWADLAVGLFGAPGGAWNLALLALPLLVLVGIGAGRARLRTLARGLPVVALLQAGLAALACAGGAAQVREALFLLVPAAGWALAGWQLRSVLPRMP
ncbi:hypothetical protein [Thermomonas flagellata]|uniref:hypothetical protein n=1 Tax=Thermomonas flagellata TaxID=2888524 RepID=UPI001F048EEF|nr:hypothetical protein [Thermomonas flagellata]